ncbi:ubiquinol-cytochrome C chaperone family protein [Aurantimonas sp. A2-1-M11]|uniref:ubiquinol-cytochrome C chaperone family protein n=1 Tax=Aurantimonas sp. A2-1-M11 TaxID=3113712 RepID=UPI002F946F33
MFQRFRANRRHRARNREVVDDLYTALVNRSRQDDLYLACAVPDTVMGRFEALTVHVFLFLRRCRDEPSLKPLAQEVVDRFITDVEDSIRELGVGDPSVPKRMRKLAGIFYERVAAYDPALDAGDEAALAGALKGRAVPADAPQDATARLASYMVAEHTRFEAIAAETILAGTLQPRTLP